MSLVMNDHVLPVNVGLYVHIPFCAAKCAYCDFNSYAGLDYLYASYHQALLSELEGVLERWRFETETVYFGGGTPTVVPTSMIVDVLTRLTQERMYPEEVTVEANPGTVTLDKLKMLKSAGINRLSLGIQSLDDTELRLLGRIHDRRTALDSFRLARESQYDNINVDLIFGLPDQSMARWHQTLDGTLSLEPDHISMYALTLEMETPLARRVQDGELREIDDDLAAEMYEFAEKRLQAEGYVHYEISNWARPGKQCRHNLIYWKNRPYLGLGAGAWSYMAGARWGNVKDPRQYVTGSLAGSDIVDESEQVSLAGSMSDTLILGLRLVEGIQRHDFKERFGTEIEQVYGRQIEHLRSIGLLEVDTTSMRLTQKGRLLGNEAFEQFLPDDEL